MPSGAMPPIRPAPCSKLVPSEPSDLRTPGREPATSVQLAFAQCGERRQARARVPTATTAAAFDVRGTARTVCFQALTMAGARVAIRRWRALDAIRAAGSGIALRNARARASAIQQRAALPVRVAGAARRFGGRAQRVRAAIQAIVRPAHGVRPVAPTLLNRTRCRPDLSARTKAGVTGFASSLSGERIITHGDGLAHRGSDGGVADATACGRALHAALAGVAEGERGQEELLAIDDRVGILEAARASGRRCLHQAPERSVGIERHGPTLGTPWYVPW